MTDAWRGLSGAAAAALLMLGACRANPRNEVPAVADAALTEVSRTAPGERLCVDRIISPWRPAGEVQWSDPPPPPGFENLSRAAFRGGGGLKGASVGGMAIGAGRDCFDLRGPLVDGDRAMVEVHRPGTGFNLWLQRTDGDWRVVTTTTSVYPS